MIATKRHISRKEYQIGDRIKLGNEIYIIVRLNGTRFGGYDYDISLETDLKKIK